jgi:ferritin-like metal-binding protein YciE
MLCVKDVAMPDQNITELKKYYVIGLRNAHALETQAVQILERQLDRLAHYPEVEDRLRAHLDESKQQRVRLEEVLGAQGETYSSIKEVVLGISGNFAALSHAAAGDEIIKNTLANYMFEHFEIATYKSLIEMAELIGDASGLAAATTSLAEEERMAAWVGEQIRPITRSFMSRVAAGAPAGR